MQVCLPSYNRSHVSSRLFFVIEIEAANALYVFLIVVDESHYEVWEIVQLIMEKLYANNVIFEWI